MRSPKPSNRRVEHGSLDALLRQPTRFGELVFLSKAGKRLSQPTLSGYWAQVLALSSRAIGAQMGWSEKAVDSLLRVYGHID